VPIAVITFEFDPILRLGDAIVVRWQAVALAGLIAAVLVATGLHARARGLRADDLLTFVIGAVPGAVIAGRLGFLVAHPEAFDPLPAALWDVNTGGLELAAGVVGGLVTAALVVVFLGARVGSWAHLVAVPLLVVVGAGKLAMVLAGSGQGLPSGAAWATAFVGPGPWSSLAPAMPSIPSQAIEGIATLLLAVALIIVLEAGAFGRRDGRVLLLGIAGWMAIRVAVSTTWRDPVESGPLPPAGWLAATIAIGSIVLLLVYPIVCRSIGSRVGSRSDDGAESVLDTPEWPDPRSRPDF
jgi:prolipoprotein diacylglyceryltransferase